MAQMIMANVAGELPPLTLEAISHLRLGLEEAIQMALRGEVTRIEVSVLKKGQVVKEWVENAAR